MVPEYLGGHLGHTLGNRGIFPRVASRECMWVDHLISIFLHVVIQTCTCFFSGVPSFEELQDPDSSPRREEVGRRTLGDYGGFLPPFFYRARFRESTSTTRKRQARTIYPNKTPIASGVEESNSPRRALLLLLSNSSGGRFLENKHVLVWTSSQRNNLLISRIEFSQESPEKPKVVKG